MTKSRKQEIATSVRPGKTPSQNTSGLGLLLEELVPLELTFYLPVNFFISPLK